MWMQTLLHKFSSTIVFNFCFYSLSLTFTHTHTSLTYFCPMMINQLSRPHLCRYKHCLLLFLLPPKKYTFHFHSSEKNDLINCFTFFPFSTFISSPLMTQELRESTSNPQHVDANSVFLRFFLMICRFASFTLVVIVTHLANLSYCIFDRQFS